MSLNPAQREAVEHGAGPLLILAGAGSGKTRVITHRIASLIRRGVEPESIVAVSFTNKAAAEMAERTVPLVGGKKASRVRMSTFHRFGLAFLREEAAAAGIAGRFVIYDQGDSSGLVKEILREQAQRKVDVTAVLARISNWKSELLPPRDVPDRDDEYHLLAAGVYPEYEARLAAMCALDFDDLVCRPVLLLRENEEVRERWRHRIEHLLVDEFQDTSEAQLELVKLLANRDRNVCVVGDDDQSIYSWRGARPGNILEFSRHFPGAKIVKLETNYRSRAPILEVANSVIAASGSRRHAKRLRAARDGGQPVRMCTTETPREEAELVASEIGRVRREGAAFDQIAVLYRSNLQARVVEEELTAHGIPYRVFGGQQFFDRKEVKDVAAYLRFVVNPRDEISLRRILNYPARGIGTRSVAAIAESARARRVPFAVAAAAPQTVDGLPDGARRSLAGLFHLLDRTRERMERSGKLYLAARDMVQEIGLPEALAAAGTGDEEGARRIRNVEYLLAFLERYEGGGPRDAKSLHDFLHRVTLDGDRRDDESGGGVTLCTLHAAKGLEFPVVFLIGCVEGQLPHTRITDPRAGSVEAGDPDEERRLFYVGITRARDLLYLTAAKRRLVRGKPVEVTPSRFVDDIPEEKLHAYERPPDTEASPEEVSSIVADLLRKHHPPDPEAAP